jgi:hypothetical protein
MGWNPWNCFGVGRTGSCKLPLPWTHAATTQTGGCHGFNESIILQQAAIMAAKLGLYPIVTLHDAVQLNHFIPGFLSYSVPVFLK